MRVHLCQVNPNIKKEKWTAEEDEKLLVLYEEHGGSWAQISRHLEVSIPAVSSNVLTYLSAMLLKHTRVQFSLKVMTGHTASFYRSDFCKLPSICASGVVVSYLPPTHVTGVRFPACAYNDFCLSRRAFKVAGGNLGSLTFQKRSYCLSMLLCHNRQLLLGHNMLGVLIVCQSA